MLHGWPSCLRRIFGCRLFFCEETQKGASLQKQAANIKPEEGGVRERSLMVQALGCPPIVVTHLRPHLQTTPMAGGWVRGSVRHWMCGRGSSQYTGDGNQAGEELGSDLCHCPRCDGASLVRAAVQSHTGLPPVRY